MKAQTSLVVGQTSLRAGQTSISSLREGGVVPPAGYVFLLDVDSNHLTDEDGYYLVEAA